MTIAHWRPPAGAPSDAVAWPWFTACKPTTVAAATPETLGYSCLFISLHVASIKAFQPRSKHHTTGQPKQTRHAGKTDRADRHGLVRYRHNSSCRRSGLRGRRATRSFDLDRGGSSSLARSMHLVGMAFIACG